MDQWRLVVGAVAVGAVVAGVVAFLAPEQYSSATTLYFAPAGPAGDLGSQYEGVLLAREKATFYGALTSQERTGADVARRLGPEWDGEPVAGTIVSSSPPDTSLLTITATNDSPEHAQNVAAAAGASLVELVNQVERPVDPSEPVGVTARVVQPATFSATPVSLGALQTVLIGLALGFVVGVGIALVRRSQDKSLQSLEEVQRVTNLPVLSAVEQDRHFDRRPLVVSAGVPVPRLEAFRHLRTSLSFLGRNSLDRVIVVTSSVAEEGRSTSVCSLGITLAQAGRSVLLVDADLRRGQLAGLLGVDSEIGLGAVLSGQATEGEAIQHALDGQLDVLPAGPTPPHPTEMLGSAEMSHLLERLRESYDTILLDTPPILPVTDAALVAGQGQGVILLVGRGRSTPDEVERSLEVLQNIGTPVLGAVFTVAPRGSALHSSDRRPWRLSSAGAASAHEEPSAPAEMVSAAPDSAGEKSGHVSLSVRPSPIPRQMSPVSSSSDASGDDLPDEEIEATGTAHDHDGYAVEATRNGRV